MESDDGGDRCDGVGIGPTGNIGGGFREAGDDLAVGAGPEDAGEASDDVAAVEVGEYEDIGATGDGAGEIFGAGGLGQQGAVDLEFAVDLDFEVTLLRVLFGEGGGGGYLMRVGGGKAAFARMAEQCDARGLAGELAAEVRGLEGDGGKLLDAGIGNDAAVGEDENALVSDVGASGVGDDAAANGVAGGGFYDTCERAEEGAGGGADAADHAVGAAVLHHHGGVVVRVQQEAAGVGEAEVFVTFEGLEKAAEIGEIIGRLRVYDTKTVGGDVFRAGSFFDDGAASEQDGDAETEFVKFPSGPQHANVFAFGKDDAFGVALEPAVDGLNKRHGRARGQQGGEERRAAQAGIAVGGNLAY